MGVVAIFKNNREGRRKAIVLANQDYTQQSLLNNTLNDADSMAVALCYIGFDVMLVKNKTLAQTKDYIDRFVASLQPGDVAFVYYSGHGIGYLRENYLLPIDFAIDGDNIEGTRNRAICTTDLRTQIMKRGVRNLFLVVDACRNELTPKASGDPYQLVRPEDNPPGTLMAFATDYGQTATEQSRGNINSLYTESLLLYLRQPLEVQELFRQANNRTFAESKRLKMPNPQYPHYIPMIYDDYYFLKRVSPVGQTVSPGQQPNVSIISERNQSTKPSLNSSSVPNRIAVVGLRNGTVDDLELAQDAAALLQQKYPAYSFQPFEKRKLPRGMTTCSVAIDTRVDSDSWVSMFNSQVVLSVRDSDGLISKETLYGKASDDIPGRARVLSVTDALNLTQKLTFKRP